MQAGRSTILALAASFSLVATACNAIVGIGNIPSPDSLGDSGAGPGVDSGGGNTQLGAECTALLGCCDSMAGGLAVSCDIIAQKNDATICTNELAAYQGSGMCGQITLPDAGSSGSGDGGIVILLDASGSCSSACTESCAGDISCLEACGCPVSGGSDGGVACDEMCATECPTDPNCISSCVCSTVVDAGGFDPQAGDQPGSCSPPADGLACSPGEVECANGTMCPVSGAGQCCESMTAGAACQTLGTECDGSLITCNEAADCGPGEICCISATGTTTATVSCQPGPTCPAGGLAYAQICRSNNECPGGSCSLWNCEGTTIEACSNPSTLVCTPG
jgi:hypothetical protein